MIKPMEVVSIRLPRSLTVEVKQVCDANRPKKGRPKLTLSELVRIALERELAARRRAKRYSAQRKTSATPVADDVLTPLLPDPSFGS
jgi:hypothetical protein